MSARIEELDWQQTPIGAVSLRRRHDPFFNTEVYEVKLDDDFLMSSLFTAAEIELARLGLHGQTAAHLDVAVGGLGLGYTALAVLEEIRVRSLIVIEALGPVIDWHQRGLVPAGIPLTADPRCRFVRGDFFAMVDAEVGLDPQTPGQRFHAIIVDIDHAPSHVLHPSHRGLYQPAGLRRLAAELHPGGCFALWSNDPPESAFLASLGRVFADVRAEVVSFHNPLQDRAATNTVYLARTATP